MLGFNQVLVLITIQICYIWFKKIAGYSIDIFLQLGQDLIKYYYIYMFIFLHKSSQLNQSIVIYYKRWLTFTEQYWTYFWYIIQYNTNLFIIVTLCMTEICTVLNYNIYTRPNGPISHFKYETYFYIRLTVGMLIV